MRSCLRSLATGGFFVVLVVLSALPAAGQACAEPSIGLVPLSDLGTGSYLGFEGGLYPDGADEPPADHLALGMARASLIAPRDAAGSPDPNGTIGLVSIGVSNTMIEFDAFVDLLAETDAVNPQLTAVNGAQGARSLEQWAAASEAGPWRRLEVMLQRNGLTPAQVQVVWIKLPASVRGTPDLSAVDAELNDLASVVTNLQDLFPNLQLAYLSSRIYAGYSAGNDSEPKAYQHGFAVKWFIERQIDGDPALNANPDRRPVEAPWIGWGPYLWADGTTPRSDGLTYECEDLDPDGIHPGPGAASKVAGLLLEHLQTDPTASGWFDSPVAVVVPTTSGPATSSSSSTSTTTTTAPASAPSTSAVAAVDIPATSPDSRSPSQLVIVGATGIGIGFVAGAAVTRRRLSG